MTIFRQLFLAIAFSAAGGAAQAGLQICNETEFVQSVSIGYKGDVDWKSEGWWNVDPGECATVVGGDLSKRYYYYRAEVNGGDFPGEGYFFCTTPEEYEIVGDTDCEGRGYDNESFREIDTGETATDFTYTLTAAESGPPRSDDGPANDDTAGLGLEICNATTEIQSVSIGYEGDNGFVSEGWWNIDPDDCALVLAGELQQQYYYYRAEVEEGPFEGEGYMFCTTPEVYTIEGDQNCESRGYETESFSEIDTGPTARGHVFYITADGNAPPPVVDDAPVVTGDGAGLQICNDSDDIQAVSIGYEGAEDWTSEGWWNVDPGDCTTPELDGVNRRYFYYRAEVDGGDFDGQNYFFCTSPSAYTIVGDAECEARGYDREDFAEVDTGGTTGTFTLTLVNADADGPTTPGDDRTEFPDEPKDVTDTGIDPTQPDGTIEEPAEPTFDFGLPDETTPEPETAPEAGTVVETAPEPEPEPEPEPVEEEPLIVPTPEVLPEPEPEEKPIRRGGSRGG